jgi:hypothetical protein
VLQTPLSTATTRQLPRLLLGDIDSMQQLRLAPRLLAEEVPSVDLVASVQLLEEATSGASIPQFHQHLT